MREGLLKLSVQIVWGTLKGAVTSPLAMLDATSRRPGVPWPAFFMLIVWSAVEATIFTFTLRPTMSELLADLTGYEVNGFALVLKGRRNGLNVQWRDLVSGEAALATALNASLTANLHPLDRKTVREGKASRRG